MSNRQDQTATDGSVAAQAGRDVNIHKHGLELADVKELVELFLGVHLPSLRAEAAAIARENANAFLKEFVERLSKPNKATQSAFSKPDSQACFNTALIGSAEKGGQVDMGLLAEMVLRRLEAEDDPLLKLVCEEAVRVMPKIGRTHIAFLAFIQYTKHVRHTAFNELSQLEATASLVLPVVQPGLALSGPNQEYLASIGVLTINPVSDANLVFESMQKNYPFFPKSPQELEATAPSISRLIDAFGKCGAPTVHLTSIGKLIGMLSLEKALGKVSLSVWVH